MADDENKEDVNNPSNQELVRDMSAAFGTLGAKIVELGTSLARADNEMQMHHLSNFIQPLFKAPNLEIDQTEELPEPFKALTRKSSMPAIEAVNAERFSFNEADFNFTMSIGSHTEVKSETAVDVKTEAGVQGGWGPVSAHFSLSADVSHKSEQTRKTDMTAKIDMSLSMKRESLPEGLAKAIDAASEFSRMANQLRENIVVKQLQEQQQKLLQEPGGDAPAQGDDDDSGDDGGTT